jgi:hypothetical protein
MSTVCVKFGIEINESEFLAGVLNWKADDLSRCIQKAKTVREVMIAIGYGDKPVLDLSGDRAAMRFRGRGRVRGRIQGTVGRDQGRIE